MMYQNSNQEQQSPGENYSQIYTKSKRYFYSSGTLALFFKTKQLPLVSDPIYSLKGTQ